jgi:hypothetical protein
MKHDYYLLLLKRAGRKGDAQCARRQPTPLLMRRSSSRRKRCPQTTVVQGMSSPTAMAG